MIAVIILAAGSSSRLGHSKQKVSLNGISLLEKTTRCALESEAAHVLVVLGAQAREHQSLISNLPVEIVVNHQWEKGMGNSLKVGLNHLIETHPEYDGALILVCDQPFLTTAHLNRMMNEFRLHQPEIVASEYQTVGVPALFRNSLFPELLKIGDQEGARKLLQHHAGKIVTIPLEGGEVDIDTPEDLKKWIP